MNVLVVVYINSGKLLEQIEGIMSYEKFLTTEGNHKYRAFSGDFNQHPVAYFEKLYKQFEDMDFDIEDSMFMVYPSFKKDKKMAISTLVFKRKGNKKLRKKEGRHS